MPREPEVHPERQGRPAFSIVADTERRVGLVVPSSLPLAYMSSVLMTYEGTVVVRDGSIIYRS